MATLTIRDLDDDVKKRLRLRAAEEGVSMEAKVRAILTDAVRDTTAPRPNEWLHRMRERVERTGGLEGLEEYLPDRREDAFAHTSRTTPFADWTEEDWAEFDKRLDARGDRRSAGRDTE